MGVCDEIFRQLDGAAVMSPFGFASGGRLLSSMPPASTVKTPSTAAADVSAVIAQELAQVRADVREIMVGVQALQRGTSATATQAAWPEIMRPKEAAAYCGVTDATLRNWRKRGLKAEVQRRVVRYRRVVLDAFMQAGTLSVDDEFTAMVK